MPESMPWPLPWSFVARFWSKVEVRGPGACWEWQASRGAQGHGRVRFSDTYETQAGRVAWALSNGEPPPADMLVCHRCDNPPCCNPAHLYVGTHADNSADMVRAGHSTLGRDRSGDDMARGERHGRAKLTEDDVRTIRDMHPAVSIRQLAARYLVSTSTISMIVRRQTWTHLA